MPGCVRPYRPVPAVRASREEMPADGMKSAHAGFEKAPGSRTYGPF